MSQLDSPEKPLEPDLQARLLSTGFLAFPEAGDYQLAFAEQDAVGCYWQCSVPLVVFHSMLDHHDTPLFVLEGILAHELCHHVLRSRRMAEIHSDEFWGLLYSRVDRRLLARCADWVELQLGPSLEYNDAGVLVRKNWRRHFKRKRDSLFDWRDRQQRTWSIQDTRAFDSTLPARFEAMQLEG